MTRRVRAAFVSIVALNAASAQTDPLPSWNDGPAKARIVGFVQAVTELGNLAAGLTVELRRGRLTAYA